jgi:hypothetical protein
MERRLILRCAAAEPADEADAFAAGTSCRIERPTRRRPRSLSANRYPDMTMDTTKVIIDYENLLRARALGSASDARLPGVLEEIRKDVSGEYAANLEQKIERWIDVTRASMWRDAKAVRFYVQAKMLYRDAFYEAAIMMARSVCEIVCYEILSSVPHPFGSPEEVERVSFRKLARFLRDEKQLPATSFDLMNKLYDIGNNYVHPKGAQNPKVDARQCLLILGESLWALYGFQEADLRAGVTMETAYSSFPDICSSYHFWMDAFASPEDAIRAEAGRSKKGDAG